MGGGSDILKNTTIQNEAIERKEKAKSTLLIIPCGLGKENPQQKAFPSLIQYPVLYEPAQLKTAT